MGNKKKEKLKPRSTGDQNWILFITTKILKVQTISISTKASVWYEVRILWLWANIKHVKSHAMALAFSLQIDMNQIFQMKYYEALQIKGMQSYKPSKFAKNEDRPRASIEHSDFSWKRSRDPYNFWTRNFMAYNFATICHWQSYSISFERSDSYLIGDRKSSS